MANTATVAPACWVCGSELMVGFLAMPGVPLSSGSLVPSRQHALDVDRGDIDLASCESCGMIQNRAFDPALVDYSPTYEASLHYSPRFQRYAEDLADRLIDRYGLSGRHVLEIGCGKGEFLRLLCERGSNHGVGFDPSYGGQQTTPAAGSLRIEPVLYSADHADVPVDLLCARHVLEHVADPARLLSGLRNVIGDRSAVLYLEVPNAEFVFSGGKVYDVIYEHCSYFSARCLTRLVEEAGFSLVEVGSSFSGQYLYVEATTGPVTGSSGRAGAGGLDTRDLVSRFLRAREVESKRWYDSGDRSGRTVLWGAGSKGVTFLNTGAGGFEVEAVIDLNPRKWGSFIPGGGQEIVSPDRLEEIEPSRVIVANPVYESEIRDDLRGRGLEPELLCL